MPYTINNPGDEIMGKRERRREWDGVRERVRLL